MTKLNTTDKIKLGLIFIILILLTINFFTYLFKDEIFHEGERFPGNMSNQERCKILGCPEGTEYVGFKGENKFFKCECAWELSIRPSSFICFQTREEAIYKYRTEVSCLNMLK